ncbi:MAG: endonuclease domain-containing protein [Betaproteobacteria bacterium]|nr:endonuclease domain-containing protein [Betaproteobacteria bacterium]
MKYQTNARIKAEKRTTVLRTHSTDAERMLWQHLRSRQIHNAKFRRQHAIENYIVDFVSFDVMLVIEIDGGQHAHQAAYDERRDAFLASAGFKVLRFWNSDVLQNLEGVLQAVETYVLLNSRSAGNGYPSPPQPSP